MFIVVLGLLAKCTHWAPEGQTPGARRNRSGLARACQLEECANDFLCGGGWIKAEIARRVAGRHSPVASPGAEAERTVATPEGLGRAVQAARRFTGGEVTATTAADAPDWVKAQIAKGAMLDLARSAPEEIAGMVREAYSRGSPRRVATV